MAEAIGLAASILQLAGAGAKLGVALYNFANSAARADEDVKYIADDVELTTNALESVGKVFQTQNAEFIVSKKAIQDANNIVNKCEDVFNEISLIVEKRRKTDTHGKKGLSMVGKLSWPMKEQRIELNRRRLESLKNSLMLLLHVLQLAQSQARGQTDKSVMEEERDKIRELHQRQQDSLQILQALESKLREVTFGNEAALPMPTTTPHSPTLSLVFTPQSTTLPPLEKNLKRDTNTFPMDLSAVDESDTSESDTPTTDDDEDPLSAEELAKCANHVQKLLKRIILLQRDFDNSQELSSNRKRRVHKMYQRFCRKFESDLNAKFDYDINFPPTRRCMVVIPAPPSREPRCFNCSQRKSKCDDNAPCETCIERHAHQKPLLSQDCQGVTITGSTPNSTAGDANIMPILGREDAPSPSEDTLAGSTENANDDFMKPSTPSPQDVQGPASPYLHQPNLTSRLGQHQVQIIRRQRDQFPETTSHALGVKFAMPSHKDISPRLSERSRSRSRSRSISFSSEASSIINPASRWCFDEESAVDDETEQDDDGIKRNRRKRRKIAGEEEEILEKQDLEFLDKPVEEERDIVDVLLEQWTVR